MATKTKDAVLSELAELGASLAEVAEDEAKKTATLNKILDSIGGLSKDDARDLFKNEKVQRLIELASDELAEVSTDGPGSIGKGPMGQKKQWTEADLSRLIESGQMEMVKNYRPITTPKGPVVWNGLSRHFRARQPITCPGCFIYVYEQHLTAEDLAEQHASWLFRKQNGLSDPSMMTENGLRARGTGDQGHYVPGGGLVDMSDREGAES